jgi:F0F1-type ATP synthase delta subunit
MVYLSEELLEQYFTESRAITIVEVYNKYSLTTNEVKELADYILQRYKFEPFAEQDKKLITDLGIDPYKYKTKIKWSITS